MKPPIEVMLRMWPAPARAHVRKDRLDHRHGAEHVDLELPAQLLQRRLFQHAFVAIAGIVDQHIDRAELGLDALDDRRDRHGVGDVQHAGDGAARRQGFERVGRLRAAHRADHAMAGGQRRLGERAAEAAADTGDEQLFGLGHGRAPVV
ncbi:hypothetical protein QE386_002559 [Pseudoxanthomonas winnipegensis]|nr:hypothetical protein [Pseudoxanthomonas winnipegensis]